MPRAPGLLSISDPKIGNTKKLLPRKMVSNHVGFQLIIGNLI
jgi:hypothetical protein